MPPRLVHLYQERHRIGIGLERRRIDVDVGEPKEVGGVEVALALEELVLREEPARLAHEEFAYERGIDLLGPLNLHFADHGPFAGLHVHRHLGGVGVLVGLEAREDARGGVPPIAQPAPDGIGGDLHDVSVERITLAEGKVHQRLRPQLFREGVETGDGEVGDEGRRSLHDLEDDVDVLGGAPDEGVDLDVRKTAPPVEDLEPDDVAAELLLVEVALLTEPEPAEGYGAGEPA